MRKELAKTKKSETTKTAPHGLGYKAMNIKGCQLEQGCATQISYRAKKKI